MGGVSQPGEVTFSASGPWWVTASLNLLWKSKTHCQPAHRVTSLHTACLTYFGGSNKSVSACQMRRWAGQWAVLTTEKSPFVAALHPPVSLCRNGKMECVPEEKGNLPPPHSQQSPASGRVLSCPYVCSFRMSLMTDTLLRLIFYSVLIFDPQSLTVSRWESVRRGKCITAARSREEAWPVHQPAATWCWTSLALRAHPASLAVSALPGNTTSAADERNLIYYR